MLGAAHLTMKDHFDMDEIFQHLVSTTGNKGKTRVSAEFFMLQRAPELIYYTGVDGQQAV